MFTGIIEEVGVISDIKVGTKESKVTINATKVLEDTKIGDSISTNGVCLTVTNLTNKYFQADIMDETFRRSNLGELSKGSKVNLERALTLKDRLGGHIVSGHIDGTGLISSIKKENNAVWIGINTSSEVLRYIVLKGSITIDGISLTVAYVDDKCFKVSIIPHTGEETILLDKGIGEKVNLECDIISKYVEKLLGIKKEEVKTSLIDEEFLKNNGFI